MQAQKLGTPCNNKKVVSRKGHGKSPRPMGSLLEQVEEKEQEPDPAPQAKKEARKKELPPAEAFKYDQPLLSLPKIRLIKPAMEWFRYAHKFFQMERKHDPFPQERAAAKQSVVGGEVEVGAKKERAK